MSLPPRDVVAPAPWPAMVLTAGLGTRLHPLSAIRAKPAVPVAGIPLAGRILAWLAGWGVRHAVLNLHHRPDTVAAAVGDGSRYGVAVRYSWEPRVLGSAGGPARALPLLDTSTFLLVNGDTLTDVDLAAMTRQHLSRGARVTMALVPNPDRLHYGGVLLAPDGAVTGFSRRGPDNVGWHFVGVQIVNADVFAALDPQEPAESVSGVYRELIATAPGAVQGFCCDATFQDIGTAADYLETSLAFAAADGLGVSALRGDAATIAAGTRVDGSVLWDRVTIGSGAVVEDCVVADDVTIPPGARFVRQAIVPAAGLAPGPHDRIIGNLLVTPLDAYRPK